MVVVDERSKEVIVPVGTGTDTDAGL